MKQELLDYSQDQHDYIQNIFEELKECGPHFFSFTTSVKNQFFYASTSSDWQNVFKEENIMEKDSFNYIEETTSPREWVCWDNLPTKYDPYNVTQRRIDVCQTIKSASFIIPTNNYVHTFNFAFDRDLDIEKFIWENNLLIENYALGMSKALFQSRS
ncbi:MAG: hypothetical protein ACRYGR_01870 [Janthinobacterium lividum]